MSTLTTFLDSPFEPSEANPKKKSVGGFLGNIWGDVGETVHGLTALGGMAVNDIVGLGQEAFSLGKAEPEFKIPQVVRGLDDMVDDYIDIYKPGGKKLGDYAYNDPLSAVGDVLTLATLGGYGAAKGAQVASKLGVAEGLAKKILPGIGTEAAEISLAGVRPVLEPATGLIMPAARELNPVKRFIRENIYDRALSYPIAKEADQYDALLRKANLVKDVDDRAFKSLLADANRVKENIVDAAENYNKGIGPGYKPLTRVYYKPVADHMVKRAADKLIGLHGSKFIRKRNDHIKAFEDFFHARTKGKNAPFTSEDLANFHKVAHLESAPSLGRRTVAEIRQMVSDPLTAARAFGISEDVSENLAKRLAPHIERLDKLVAEGADQVEIASADRYIQALGERINIQAAIERGEDVDKYAEAMSDLRLMVDERLTNPLMAHGAVGMDYTTALDRMYAPRRKMLHHGASKRAADLDLDPHAVPDLDGGDPFDLEDLMEKKGIGLEMDDELLREGMQAPIYFPHIDPMRVKTMDFLMGKSRQGALRGTTPFMKRWGGHLFEEGKDGKLMFVGITDPVEAYTRRVSQVTKYLETYDMIQHIANRFGRKLTGADLAKLGNGEVLYSPGLVRAYVGTRIAAEDELAEALAKSGGAMEDMTAEAITAAIDKTAQKIDPLKMGDVYALPKAVADRLDSFTKLRFGWRARMYWDAPINLWRSFVLAGSPRWVLYNLLGNITFLKMQGGRLSDVARLGVSKLWQTKIKKLIGGVEGQGGFYGATRDLIESTGEDISAGVHGGFFSGTNQYQTHYGAAENTGIAQMYKLAQQTKPVKLASRFAHNVREFNEHLEETFRMGSFLQGVRDAEKLRGAGVRFLSSENSIQKLMRDGLSEADAMKALDEVNYFFNDYNALSPMERNIVRRFIAPFYSFYKHTVKLMLSYPFTHPIRSNMMNKLTQLTNEINDIGMVPDWLEGAVPTGNLGQPDDPMATRFLTARGVNPFTNLGQSPEQMLFGAMNPFLKTGYEQITGTSTLTGEPFTAPDVFTPFGSDQQYRIDPDTMTVEPINRVAPNLGTHLASSIPQFVLLRDLAAAAQGQLGSRYGTGQVVSQPGGEEPKFPKSGLQELAQFAGLSSTDYGLLPYQIRRLQEEQDALRGMLRVNPQLFFNAS